MTAAPEAPPRPASPIERWLRLGLLPRPWLHALAAFAGGALLATPIPQTVILVLFTGIPGLLLTGLVALAVACTAFGGIGAAFLGRRLGWWQSFAGVVWLPIAVGLYWNAMLADGGEFRGVLPVALLTAGITPAVCALLAHAGPPRAVAALAVVGILTSFIAPPIVEDRMADEAERARIIALVPRPFVTELDGYQRWGDGAGTVDGTFDRMQVAYRTDAVAASDGNSVAFVVVSDFASIDACGSVPIYSEGYFTAEEELVCERVDDGWVRTSATGHELARLIDGTLVRISASQLIPVDDLRAALDAAALMDDADFDRLLEMHGA